MIEIQDYLLDQSLADSFSLASRTQKRRKVFKASFESERDIILRNDDVFGGMHLAPIKWFDRIWVEAECELPGQRPIAPTHQIQIDPTNHEVTKSYQKVTKKVPKLNTKVQKKIHNHNFQLRTEG